MAATAEPAIRATVLRCVVASYVISAGCVRLRRCISGQPYGLSVLYRATEKAVTLCRILFQLRQAPLIVWLCCRTPGMSRALLRVGSMPWLGFFSILVSAIIAP